MTKCIGNMKNITNDLSIYFVAIIIATLCACTRRSMQELIFYPDEYVSHYSVEYRKDTIVIAGTYKTGEKVTKLTLAKEYGEYYLVQFACDWQYGTEKRLFMSNKQLNYQRRYEAIPQQHSISIKRYDNNTIYSEIIVHPNEESSNPLICIEYDRNYRIKRILQGAIYDHYKEDKK